MSSTPPPDTEVEEGSPVGEAICEDSSPENTMHSSAATEIEENTEQTDENLFPFNSVSVELYEGPEESEDSSQTKISEYEAGVEEANNETQDMQGVGNTLCSSSSNSRDSRTNLDAVFSDASKSNMDEPDACEPAAIEPAAEDSSDTYDPNIVIKDEIMDTEELQKTYIEDFLYSNTSASFDEASNSASDEKGCPLSRFSKIVRAVEQADYETLQMLYQLLYQRSAWDTQEILTQRILEFSGFNFSQHSEDYFNREMMLRTQPDDVLRKIGAILCLEMRKFSDTGKERHDLIASIMEFLSKPKRKSRASRGGTDVKKDEERNLLLATDKCGCRNRCLKKFTEAQKKNILRYLDLLETEKMLDAYIVSLFQSKKIERKPGAADENKKLKEVLYQYKVKHGKKEVPVCKGAFCILHGIKLGKVNQLQIKVKSGGLAPLDPKDYPPFITDGIDDKDVDVNENEVKDQQKSPNQQKSSNQQKSPNKNRSKKKSSAGPKSSKIEARKSVEDYKTEEELKESITSQKVIPKVVIEKVDLKAVTSIKISEIEDTEVSGVKIGINTEVENKVDADVKENQKSDEEKKEKQILDEEKKENQKLDEEKKENKKPEKLKDFPLVVRSIENAPEELLIDIHFLLYLSSATAGKVKENILEFSGFPFDADTEEFDERNEFLQRMSNKIIADVARSFSLGLLSTKEDTIKNILSFLSKPDESYLRAVAVPVILSDVELDDIGDMSDSDESITCEVVEKKVECIDLISSGDESDKEDKAGKQTKKPPSPKKTTVPQASTSTNFQTSTFSPVIMPGSAVSNSTPSAAVSTAASVNTAAPVNTTAPVSNSEATPGQKRTLRNFETICKIVNTHPHEYLVDIYDLLYLKKHEPSTLRNDILDFSGFTFEKGSTEYIKRKQLLDRMLYNSVRRIYNTLIHTTTEVKVYSKPTMIAEIFQFLFKLPDHDTSVRPPPTTKPAIKPALNKGCPVVKVVPGMAGATVPPAPLPSQSGKLSDLKRVFQRVACFPCEYLIDVHKLLFMSDCDPKVIRQNIFGFKGFSFGVDSPEFQQRKMYLEYLTFHSLRKISSVLTTRSVDLRNSTKHELATHLTQVLAEYCNTYVETEPIGTETPANQDNQNNENTLAPTSTTTSSPTTTSTATPDQTNNDVENIVVTPILDPLHANPSSGSPESVQTPESTSISELKNDANAVSTPKLKNIPPKENPKSVTVPPPLSISIVDTRSIRSPATTTTAAPRGRRKRKSTPVKEVVKDRPPPAEASQFADINLPEIEQYRQLYGQNLNIYNPNLPTISAYSGSGVVPQSFPHLVPQTMPFPVVHTFPTPMQVQNPYPGVPQPSQMIGLQPPIAPGLVQQSNILPNKQNEVIVPGECVLGDTSSEEPASKKARIVVSSGDKNEKSPSKKTGISTDDSFSLHNKLRDAMSTADDEEDCDKPLASLIGHPIDSVLKKHICDIVEQTDLQDITINGVIQKIYSMYPKFDLSYRKEFIKSTLRSILYRLGEQKNSSENEKSISREASSPDCRVTTTDNRDSPLPESCDVEAS